MSEEKKKKAKLQNKLREQTVGYITAALGLVAGLAWNDAVKTVIDMLYPAQKGGNVLAKFWYATIITLIIVIISYYLLHFAGPRDEDGK